MGPGGSPLPISTTQTSSISLCDHQCNIIVCATITDHNVTIDNCHKIETFFLDDKQINKILIYPLFYATRDEHHKYDHI